MKSIRIAGLCLAAMFVMSMVAAGTASAAPHWLVCLAFTTGATRYETHQCEKASGTGSWEWSELKNTELPVKTQGTLTLEAKAPVVGEVEVKCSGVDEGFVGPGGSSRTTVVKATKCEKGKNCEELVANKGETEAVAAPVNLPWSGELKETENAIHGTATTSSEKAPGWRVTCKVLGKVEENECTTQKGLVILESKDTPSTLAALLVLSTFINPNKPKANCTATGAETGNVSGSIAILLANGWGLRVSK